MRLVVLIIVRILRLFVIWLLCDQVNYAKHLDFVKYCESRQTLASQDRLTIRVLKEKFSTDDCEVLAKNLRASKSLWLAGLEIENINFLKYFVHFERLDLSDNRIRSIDALRGLRRMTHLWLAENEVEDIRPLLNMPNLELLEVTENRIRNIDVLSNCPKLRALNISGNWIADISPLKKHEQLNFVFLSGNMIEDLSPIAYHPFVHKLNNWAKLATLQKQAVIDWTALKIEKVQPNAVFRVVALGENPLGRPAWHAGVIKNSRNCPSDSSYEVVRNLCRS